MNTEYMRVIPRDLFNEAKLLKCVGRLVLLIHDGYSLNGMTFEHNGDPFVIGQDEDGRLSVTNIIFSLNDQVLEFKTRYNDKSNFPLECEFDWESYTVFNEQGEYTDEFKEFCDSIVN